MGLFTSALARPQRRDIGDVGNPLIPQREPVPRRTGGQAVTAQTAMALSAVWSCVGLRADLMSTIPLEAVRKVAGIDVTIATPSIWVTPSGYSMGVEDWLFASQISLDLRGNSFGVIASKDRFGLPTQIELQNPDKVTVRETPGKAPVYKVNGTIIPNEEIWHERLFPVAGSVMGLSPLAFAARSVGIVLAAQTFGGDWFADGAHPSAVLESDKPISETQATIIKKRFIAAVRGTREPVVMGLGLKYKAIQVAANESQFLETIRASDRDVCRFFGRIPPEMVGGDTSTSMTYANLEQRFLSFLILSFNPLLVRRETALSRALPTPQRVEFQRSALLRTDLVARYTAHNMAIAGKWLAPSEVRRAEGKPPFTQAQLEEVGLVPLTVTPTGKAKANPGGSGLPPLSAPDDEPAADDPTDDEGDPSGG